MNLVENKDYEIIPDKGDEQAWNVRVLSGLYTETVLKYGVVKFNGKGKEKYMSFNFDIIYTPDTELTKESVELQEFAGLMLEQIMARGIEEGNVITRDIKENNAN
jgi:hypothetical protein|tara:strand:- start:569 stop:883 length:315 start_codon:yes stop_codon:yes gene_type:complete